ncbi:MAG: GNAT family N-acetyltransferase [Parvularcula sp.]|nr:GNAT family N-acetyltransferase [Parvularcula sp.]
MTPRLATPRDEDDLVALHRAVFPEDPWDEEFWRGAAKRDHDVVVVMGEPLSAFAVVRLMGEDGDLLTIGSAQKRQGQGRQVLSQACVFAAASGVKRLFLEVSTRNRVALTFYEGFGFERVGLRRRYYKDGSDAGVMRLRLAPGD